MKIFNKKALTFIELVVSAAISIIIFIILFSFIWDSLESLANSNKKAQILSKYYSLYDSIWEIKTQFSSWVVLVDNISWEWSDVFLIKSMDNSNGLLFWIVDKSTMLLETWSIYKTYWDKNFWYKNLSLSEISNIQTNPWDIFNISFNNAKLFDIPIKDYQVNMYNSWSIFSFNFDLLIWHNKFLDWKLWSEISSDSYETYKINFTF